MPQWLQRTSKELLNSVAAADLPEAQANYIEEPNLSAVAGYPPKYWTITGDTVSLKNQTERDAVDAAEQTARVAADRTRAESEADDSASVGMRMRSLIETFNKRDNYLVNRIAELQAALDAIKASSGPADNIRNAIPASWLATNTRTRAQAVTAYKDEISTGAVDN